MKVAERLIWVSIIPGIMQYFNCAERLVLPKAVFISVMLCGESGGDQTRKTSVCPHRWDAIIDPRVDEFHAMLKVDNPGSQGLQGRICLKYFERYFNLELPQTSCYRKKRQNSQIMRSTAVGKQKKWSLNLFMSRKTKTKLHCSSSGVNTDRHQSLADKYLAMFSFPSLTLYICTDAFNKGCHWSTTHLASSQ